MVTAAQVRDHLADAGVDLLRPARKGEAPRAGSEFFKPLRQVIDRSTTRSKVSWIWSATAVTPRPECGFGSRNPFWP
jgi:hypothetical protein